MSRNIIVCAEENLLMQLCVNLTALGDTNPGNQFHIYVVCAGLGAEDRQWLAQNMPRTLDNVEYLVVEEVTPEQIEKVLPDSVEHALFLDYLTLVCGAFAPVYDAVSWTGRIAVWHELQMEREAEGIVIRYEYGAPWMDQFQLEDSLVWWKYARMTPFYVPMMELFVMDTVRQRRLSRATYEAYDEYEQLTADYKKYKEFFDRNTGRK